MIVMNDDAVNFPRDKKGSLADFSFTSQAMALHSDAPPPYHDRKASRDALPSQESMDAPPTVPINPPVIASTATPVHSEIVCPSLKRQRLNYISLFLRIDQICGT
ncbi:hypothetical protein AcW1_006445 [Taiwanofungus camphoratus]|nr:hypothetical protein AcV5_009029 [Antrodia cinnamomea]KAI0924285.1 hypothetical protein AcW2_005206 [Antrodia cinnamomea]KAI0940870.1 hypothetical protein AcV7_003132 [Antrodia cinnamomea]KAI0954609.1 hypothetical protein AcW1_006445 [Antrodia cinnamomea]